MARSSLDPQRRLDRGPRHQLEILRRAAGCTPSWATNRPPGKPGRNCRRPARCRRSPRSRQTCRRRCGSGRRGHAGQAIERIGVVALARGDQIAAVRPRGSERQPLDIGDEVLAVDPGDELAGGARRGGEAPDARRPPRRHRACRRADRRRSLRAGVGELHRAQRRDRRRRPRESSRDLGGSCRP